MRLTGEHEALFELPRLQGVVDVHLDRARARQTAAGRTHAAFAAVRNLEAAREPRIDDRRAVEGHVERLTDAVADHGDARGTRARRRRNGRARGLRRVRGREQLRMEGRRCRTQSDQGGLGRFDHRERTAQIDPVQRRRIEQRKRQAFELGFVQTAVEQNGILFLAAQDMRDRKARHVPVLEVLDLLAKGDRIDRLVGVDHRHARPGLLGQEISRVTPSTALTVPKALARFRISINATRKPYSGARHL